MPARAYATRLALLLLIFVVAIPGGVVGLLYVMEHTPGGRGAALGFGYLAYFIGIPLWILGFGIALWWTARARVRTVGLPNWVALSLVVLVLADWRFFLWMFRPFFAPFLGGAIVLLVALLFWPDRAAPGRVQPQSPGREHVVAVWAWGIFAVLACLSLAASLAWIVTTAMPAYLIDGYAKWLAYLAIVPLCGITLWAVIEGRRTRAGT